MKINKSNSILIVVFVAILTLATATFVGANSSKARTPESPVNIYFDPTTVNTTGQQTVEVFMDTNGTDVNSVQLWVDWGGSACSDVANGAISNSCPDCDLTNTILPVIYEGPPAGTDEALGIFGPPSPPANGNNIKVAEIALDVTCDPGMVETLLMFEPYMDPGFGTLYVNSANENTPFDDATSEVVWMETTAIELSGTEIQPQAPLLPILLVLASAGLCTMFVLSSRKFVQ